jgi:preprotein translocase subunit SecE
VRGSQPEAGSPKPTRINLVKTSTIDNVNRPTGEGGMLSRPVEWWTNLQTFLTEVRNELKRVSWPSRKEVYATTLVVILVSVFFGVYLWGVDMVLSHGVQWIFKQFGGTA